MKKDPDLESALSRNRRWMVNNQIKNIILRCPNQVAPIGFLQKKFKSLDLQGKALNWLKKYPCCFQVYREDDEHFCQLTKRMKFLVEEEEIVKDAQEPVLVKRLAKLLMMSRNKRLNDLKVNELKRNFWFPDDYLLRFVPKYTDMFRVVNFTGRQSSMEIELISWNPEFAVSEIEALAEKEGRGPSFSCLLPETWVKSRERFREFNSTPYAELRDLMEGSNEMDKRSVGLMQGLHEYNRRHYLMNLEKKKKKGMTGVISAERGGNGSCDDDDDQGGGIFDAEERKRFYKVLFEDDAK